MAIYQTKVVNIGSEAKMFIEEKMVVLFGENAPAELADYTFNIIVNPLDGEIEPGMKLRINNQEYIVTAVGNAVKKNLEDLGHITIRFTGEKVAELAGTLYVEDKQIDDIQIGTEIALYK
ncbi:MULTISPECIES: PTS glucitol/sorbitol transporter subunit IIA [Globicatella]|uniref:PTS glucitol/sorbitol transporter subunit IIA n=1 Tax=Globicatella TaxID=13075 RepID=UPI0008CD8C01|nr:MULTISPECIES: PTS glucitol/sorbitol transporter subunit IIA [Globicatella]MDK7630829.1 PTS glucitol/sorbitol transporter subunit IIA [Globicatella sanguinis]OFK58995.1 PTS sorbitol transporter subunit IIA [Globicatella sp. HMSC072A10]WIK67111.1 PTS glucitol/sorbitol transporter subunit IIA [Globicatella sanguinis]WKT56516.1 PTS glucitol/sorbitol transporter subunit IIA [Globicatella sanguinis]